MCGIVGSIVFDDHNFRVTQEYIVRMRDVMAHRGPDGAGVWVDSNGRVGLGHRRLSIIDLSECAAQPMSNEDDTLWVSFNGEIYNHAEIRRELEKIGGHRWKTDHSDTEVILHAFEEWGIECVHRFRGMFAIALWDVKKREMWLIRDRIGIKPLCYSAHNGRLTFASEIKALLQDPDQKRAVHEEAFFHYLSFLTTPAPQTLFDGIKKLPAGCWLRVSASGEMREERYWDVWDHVQSLEGVSEEEIAERVLAELRTAVQLRKESDVPVGVFLSGGIDSSTNAALFSEGESGAVKTFSIGYDTDYGTYKNELHYARQMAETVNAEYYERRLTQDDLLDFLPKMVQLQDEPIADPVCVPVYYVSKLARDNGVIVCQVGEGADELFCGYPGWPRIMDLQRRLNAPMPNALKWLGLSALRMAGREMDFPFERLRRNALGQPIFWGGAEAFTQAQKQQVLSKRLRKQFRGFSSWEAIRPIHERFEEKAPEKSNLNWMSYLDLNMRLPELLLMRVDKMSMGVSLEGRVPFLDHEFVALSMSIPSALKTKNKTLKYVLKEAVRDLIPEEIINRPKQGFGVPVHEWLVGRLGDTTRAELKKFCKQTDFINPLVVDHLFETRKYEQIWYLFNFALWWAEYIG